MTRTRFTVRNALWQTISTILTFGISFISRTIFIHFLNITYVGINSLFANILGLLSLAELGIGMAMVFSLYKPVAEHDIPSIKAYMHAYKIAYRVIACIVTVLGLSLLPFISNYVKGVNEIKDLKIYYLIYLLNSILTYFVSYKFSLLAAEQKNYISTIIQTSVTVLTSLLQILVLAIYHSFLLYLLSALIFGLLRILYTYQYFSKRYKYLNDKGTRKLSKDEMAVLRKSTTGLVLHKIGDLVVRQTDTILVSTFISIQMVGLIANYNLIINGMKAIITGAFTSITGNIGNLIVTTNKSQQHTIYKRYEFLCTWAFGFCTSSLFFLMTPFIHLWLGPDMVVKETVIFLIVLDVFIGGVQIPIFTFKTAAGIFIQDSYMPLVQSIVKLASSIVLFHFIGIAGIYLGTLICDIYTFIFKPIIVYKRMFDIPASSYFVRNCISFIPFILTVLCISYIRNTLVELSAVNVFILLAFSNFLVYNIFFILFNIKRTELSYYYKYTITSLSATFQKTIVHKRNESHIPY